MSEGDLEFASNAGGRLRRFVASARTNLPDWPSMPAEVDQSGHGFILVGVGEAGRAVADRWVSAVATLGGPCVSLPSAETPAPQPLLDAFDRALDAAVVGWRLMLAGPPSEVLLLAARARVAGLIDAEIRIFACDDGVVHVQCAHCRMQFRTVASPGDERACPGCGLTLVVHQHLSRRIGALVGFLAEGS